MKILVKVDTQPDEVKPDLGETDKLKELLNPYQGLDFDDAKVPPVYLEYEKEFMPNQPPFRNVPIQYESEVNKLLDRRVL